MDILKVPPGGRPEDKEAELALLGCVFLEPELAGELGVKPSDFYSGACQVVWAAFIALAAQGVTPDVVAVNQHLQAGGLLDRVGGTAFLVEVQESVPSAANARWFARCVLRNRQSRDLMQASARISEMAQSPVATADELFGEAERLLFGVTQGSDGLVEPVDTKKMVGLLFDNWEAYAKGKGDHELSTGFPSLDTLMGGLSPSELVLLAGRPSMGKSSLGNRIIRNLAHAGHPVALFTLEVPARQVASNIIAAEVGISTRQVQRGQLSDGERHAVLSAMDDFGTWPLHVHDTPDMSIQEVTTVARRLVRRRGVRAIFVDYIQLLTVTGPEFERADKRIKVDHISGSLKKLARELEVPVIALAQLSRKNEDRKDRRPMLSDLKESGSLEQDADAVLLLHRPEYYEPGKADLKGKAELLVAKNRNGATGKVALEFEKHCMLFEDAPPDEQPAQAKPEGRPKWMPRSMKHQEA